MLVTTSSALKLVLAPDNSGSALGCKVFLLPYLLLAWLIPSKGFYDTEICKGMPFTSGILYSIPHISDLETLSTCERLPRGDQYTSSCIPQEEVHTDDVIFRLTRPSQPFARSDSYADFSCNVQQPSQFILLIHLVCSISWKYLLV